MKSIIFQINHVKSYLNLPKWTQNRRRKRAIQIILIGDLHGNPFEKSPGRFLLVGVIIIVGFTILQPYLPAQKSPTEIYLDEQTGMQARNIAPSAEFWFGTNSIGQDLWSRIWAGTRTSLFIGCVVALVEAVVGITIGTLWGFSRKLEAPITQLYNVVDNIPTTIVLILMSYILRPSISTIIIAMCITGWVEMARFIRNQIVILRDREYNLASKCLGTPDYRIILKIYYLI